LFNLVEIRIITSHDAKYDPRDPVMVIGWRYRQTILLVVNVMKDRRIFQLYSTISETIIIIIIQLNK
jgi:hypothetical protein